MYPSFSFSLFSHHPCQEWKCQSNSVMEFCRHQQEPEDEFYRHWWSLWLFLPCPSEVDIYGFWVIGQGHDRIRCHYDCVSLSVVLKVASFIRNNAAGSSPSEWRSCFSQHRQRPLQTGHRGESKRKYIHIYSDRRRFAFSHIQHKIIISCGRRQRSSSKSQWRLLFLCTKIGS